MDLISDLGLQPHPEGGYFREIFKSAHKVQRLDEKSVRSALTTIYFLLTKGEHGRWHRVASDEAWHFYEGDPLEVYWIDGQDVVHQEVLAMGIFQTLIRCAWNPLNVGKQQGLSESIASWDGTVAPGFEFERFRDAFRRIGSAHTHITSLNATLAELA